MQTAAKKVRLCQLPWTTKLAQGALIPGNRGLTVGPPDLIQGRSVHWNHTGTVQMGGKIAKRTECDTLREGAV